MSGKWSDALQQEAVRQPYKPRPPFPFDARVDRLKEDFMAPYLRDLAKNQRPEPGLDRIGWAICRFMFEIADFQGRRLARNEMLKCDPPEAPWLYRDLYQLDRCDEQHRISIGIPEHAVHLAHHDGHSWFLSWQYWLWAQLGRAAASSRRPETAPSWPTLPPSRVYNQLTAAGWKT